MHGVRGVCGLAPASDRLAAGVVMANYEESMFEDQDDLVERAVAWLCQASEDAGQDAGERARTLVQVIENLDALREAACGEIRRQGGLS